jgi:threonine dehydratase
MSTPVSPTDLAYPCVTAAELNEAAERIAPYVHRTPVVPFDGAVAARGGGGDGGGGGSQLLLKLDMLQSVGSFKIRSAANIVRLLQDRDPELLARG